MKTALNPIAQAVMSRSVTLLGLLAVSVFATGCATKQPAFDPALEAARVQLLEGTITRDQSVIQPMLAPDFAWREDIPPVDEEPYDFWNRYKLWGNLQEALKDRPMLRDGVWISPHSALRSSYKGMRVAWRKVGSEWRLAYVYPGTALAQ
jgi:hypothetical protein